MSENTARPYVNKELLEKARQMFPETQGLDLTALVDFLIRRALEKEHEKR